MHLKSLKAEGFKSFADKIELDFQGGITAIVGPNGSGKSNISDAIRWVLGEQSAKSLRGAKMEDVIFSGTQKRNKMGFAEVVITLLNNDKLFNSPFDEIVISRKVFASGESQYAINGAGCRLKDIHEIFMDTGVGREGYSMIGQGKIDEILSTKSEDRRIIFDEAAGISKYRHKKEEAERKLFATEENITRLSDIISELSTQLTPLETQSQKAKKYLELKEELKVYEVNGAINVIENNKKNLVKIDEDIDIATKHLTETKNMLSDFDDEQEKVFAIFNECDTKISELENSLRSIEMNNSILKSEAEVMKNTINSNLLLIERIKDENDTIKQKIEESKNNIELLEKEKETLKEKICSIENEIKQLEFERDNSDDGQGDSIKEADEIREKIISGMNVISELKIKVSNAEIMINTLKSKYQSTEKTIDNKKAELSSANDKLSALEKEKKELIDFLSEKSNVFIEFKETSTELENKLYAQKKEADEKVLAFTQMQTKLKMLLEMEQNFGGYPKSVKAVMLAKDTELKNAKIYGPLSKIIVVEKKYTLAIEVALGGALLNIVVKTEEDAKKAIEYLKKTKTGRATFMPVSAIKSKRFEYVDVAKEKGFVALASDLVSCDSEFTEIVKSQLGRCVVVDNMDNAISISRKFKNAFKIVTLSGEVLNAGGTISGGFSGANSNILGRENEINELKKVIKLEETAISQLKNEIMDTEKEIVKNRNKYEDLSFTISEHKERLLVIDRDIQHEHIVLSNYSTDISELSATLIRTEKEIERKVKEKEDIGAEITTEEASVQKIRDILDDKEAEIENAIFRKEKLSDDITKKVMEKSDILKDISFADEKKEALLLEITQSKDSLELRNHEINDIEEKNKQLDEDAKSKLVLLDNAKAETEAIFAEIEKVKEIKKEHEEASKAVQSESKDLRDRVYALTAECSRLESKKEKYETEIDATISKLWDEYEIIFSEAEKYRQDLGSQTTINKVVSELKAKIKNLGNINVDAIEEYKAVKERFEFLSEQRSDLEKAKSDLNQIIDEMLTVMRKRFSTEFEKIAKHFKTTFTELFGGGTAEVYLSEPDNVLESPINIDVQPPGKKLQSLLLLSGGERALSAIALLFAIIKTRPAPFCFLDEIEAALDESNVYRFAEYIKNYSKKTQFILITHRRGTMECADTIYGVTMQEKGVSKLLKLNINEIS